MALSLTLASHVLLVMYTVLALVSGVQVARSFHRLRELVLTTQRSFLTLTLVVCTLRAVYFGLLPAKLNRVDEPLFLSIRDETLFAVLAALANSLYYCMYTLLILFWSEIVGNARHASGTYGNSSARLVFGAANMTFFLVQLSAVAVVAERASTTTLESVSKFANLGDAALFALGAGFFVYWGGRLVLLLVRFPVQSAGRRSKIVEVSTVAVACTLCFVARAIMLVVATLESLEHAMRPSFLVTFYCITEIAPSLLVLYALRRLPRPADDVHRPLNGDAEDAADVDR